MKPAGASSSPTSMPRPARRSCELDPRAFALRRQRRSRAAAAVTAAVEAFGALHGLVNCAGIATGEKVIGRDGSAAPLAGFARVVNINLVGSFNMLRVAAAQMARQAPNADGERGVLINTASVAAFDGQSASRPTRRQGPSSA